MTQDQNPGINAAISDVIGPRIRDLRERAGMSREDLAAAAVEAGASTLTGTVIRFLETGRPGRDGRRTRYFTFDELLGLAAGLEVSPRELLGDQAVLFAGDDRRDECPTCAADAGVLEATVRNDIKALAELGGMEPSLAETAIRLARAIDQAVGDEVRLLPALSKELRATLAQIEAGREEKDPDDEDEFGDLDEPE